MGVHSRNKLRDSLVPGKLTPLPACVPELHKPVRHKKSSMKCFSKEVAHTRFPGPLLRARSPISSITTAMVASEHRNSSTENREQLRQPCQSARSRYKVDESKVHTKRIDSKIIIASKLGVVGGQRFAGFAANTNTSTEPLQWIHTVASECQPRVEVAETGTKRHAQSVASRRTNRHN